MVLMRLFFDNVKHENDNYNREELIIGTEKIFGEIVSHREAKKRARLWYAADHLVNSKMLDKLSHSPYIEVRESVAENKHTAVHTLEKLIHDDDFQVRATAIANSNTPLSNAYELLNDSHEDVRNEAKYRLQSEQNEESTGE